MKRSSKIIFITLIAFLSPILGEAREPQKPHSSNAEAQAYIDKAWSALDQDMTINEIDVAIKYLEKAVKLDPQNDLLLCELAGEYFQRGYQMPADNKSQIEAMNDFFKRGYETAQKANSIRESAGSHGWSAANLGALKQHSNFISQAAILPEMNTHLDWITQNDKDYKYGLVTRFWTGIMTRAPDMILDMLGEDPEGVFQDLLKAIEKEPRYVENYIYLAEFYHSVNKKDEALKWLQKGLSIDLENFPEERAYNRFGHKKAKIFWKEWTGKEYPNK
jgi:tetratricopeptide (TPR) repeat protein